MIEWEQTVDQAEVALQQPRIVVLTSGHRYDDARIFEKECRSLARSGYSVRLIAPGDESGMIDGVEVSAIPGPRSRLGRLLITPFRLLMSAIRESPRAFHLHDLELVPIGLILRSRGHVVMDLHEDFPSQVLTYPWKPRVLTRIAAIGSIALEWIAARFFDVLIAATPAIGAKFPPRKTQVVQNFPSLELFDNIDCDDYAERPKCVVYVGGVTREKGAEEMVQAIELLDPSLLARLRMIGPFNSASIEHTLRGHSGWGLVDYEPWQDRPDVVKSLTTSRVGLAVFHPTPNHLEAEPVKIFEYMAAGIPVIASRFPLWVEIVEETGCGVTVDWSDPKAIADAMEYLLTNQEVAARMGATGRRKVLETLNWEAESRKLISAYEDLA